jgi:hypothetical protein
MTAATMVTAAPIKAATIVERCSGTGHLLEWNPAVRYTISAALGDSKRRVSNIWRNESRRTTSRCNHRREGGQGCRSDRLNGKISKRRGSLAKLPTAYRRLWRQRQTEGSS